MKHSKHFFRAGVLIVGGFFAFLIVRSLLLPDSFGRYGPYRGDNVKEQMEEPMVFGSRESCAECHSDTAVLHSKGKHTTVQCQNCHAPLTVHIEDGTFKEMMPIDRDPALCLKCHRVLPSRPVTFQQIDPKQHLESMGQTMGEGVCITCHQPHRPNVS